MTIKEQAPDADVLEIETAAFELFHDEHGNWNWRLVDEGGETTARGPRMLPTEEEAREAMDRLVGTAEDSDARAMEDAVFQVYAADEEWRWQFVLPDGTIVADGEDTYGTRDEAVSGIQSEIREVASAADVHAIEEVALRIDARGDRYSWRVIDTDRDSLAVSSRAHADREDAVAEVQQFRDNADDASVFDLAGPAFQLQRTNEQWRWRLIDEDREEIMRAPGGFETREAAEAAIEHVEDIAPDAGVLDYDAAAFELLEEDGRWYWQLIDEDGLVLASGANNYSSRDAAAEALEDVRAELEEASILEIEIAAFEIQEDDGQWRWRLIDENGTPMAQSVRSYDSRR
jgi:uncharacterized protein YegP (UPF0339 family)